MVNSAALMPGSVGSAEVVRIGGVGAERHARENRVVQVGVGHHLAVLAAEADLVVALDPGVVVDVLPDRSVAALRESWWSLDRAGDASSRRSGRRLFPRSCYP